MDVVKKYSNRRLYDTGNSEYVTLEQLAQKVRDGTDVEVIDADANEDITQAVLAQIVLDTRGVRNLIPVDVLTKLIRMDDEALAEFIREYMPRALQVFGSIKQSYETVQPFKAFVQMLDESNPITQLFCENPPGADGAHAAREPEAGESSKGNSSANAAPSELEMNEDSDSTSGSGKVSELQEELGKLKRMLQNASKKQNAQSENPRDN